MNTLNVVLVFQEATGGGRVLTKFLKMTVVTGFDLLIGPGNSRRAPSTTAWSGPNSDGEGMYAGGDKFFPYTRNALKYCLREDSF